MTADAKRPGSFAVVEAIVFDKSDTPHIEALAARAARAIYAAIAASTLTTDRDVERSIGVACQFFSDEIGRCIHAELDRIDAVPGDLDGPAEPAP